MHEILPSACEAVRVNGPRHTRRSTLAACVAQLAGVAAADVPLDWEDVRPWLAGRGLGLVPVADPGTFAWAGPWLATRAARSGGEPLGAVLFGVPSGPIFDPGATEGPALEGWVLAPLDAGTWTPPDAPADVGQGVVEAIVVSAGPGAPSVSVDAAVAVPGRGLEGDRYATGTGTFGSGRPGSALTVVAAEVLEALGRPLDHRRNLVVRGLDVNGLVGRDFRVGEVRCRGQRLAEPCARLDVLNGGGVLRALVHRAGLRADIVSGGTIRVGDAVTAAPPPG